MTSSLICRPNLPVIAVVAFFSSAGVVLAQFTEPKLIPAEEIVEQTTPAEETEPATPAVTPVIDEDVAPASLVEATPATPTNAKALMKAAFEKTKTAENVADFTAIITQCNQALAANPDQKGINYTHRLLAWSHNRRGKLYTTIAETADATAAKELEAAALADFETAVKYDPTKWQAVHNRGVSYALANRNEEAIADFTTTIQLNRTYVNVWFNRGEIYYEQGELKKAIVDYSEAIRLNPEDAGAYTSRGHANYELGNYRDAINDFNRAVQYDRTNAVAVTDRADLYSNLGIWERAARDYRTAVQMNPKLGRAYLGAAWLMATCPDDDYRDAKLAVVSAEKAIEFDGRDDYRYLDTLAAAYANDSQWELATTALKQAIAIAPAERQTALKARMQTYAQQQPYRDATRTALNEDDTARE